jgi:hypothetical protein
LALQYQDTGTGGREEDGAAEEDAATSDDDGGRDDDEDAHASEELLGRDDGVMVLELSTALELCAALEDDALAGGGSWVPLEDCAPPLDEDVVPGCGLKSRRRQLQEPHAPSPPHTWTPAPPCGHAQSWVSPAAQSSGPQPLANAAAVTTTVANPSAKRMCPTSTWC